MLSRLSLALLVLAAAPFHPQADAKPRKINGVASYYWQPQRVASGGWFKPHGMTAAHRTLPFGTRLRVSEPRSGRSVIVTVNDRGPYIRGRVLDLSLGAARKLGITPRGLARVTAEIL